MKSWNKGKLGVESHSWKGGKYINNGYICIYNPEHHHPNHLGKYVFEHRLVMERMLGRYLKPEEVVHHINRNLSDNRIENLMLFPNLSKHLNFHHRKEEMEKSKTIGNKEQRKNKLDK